MVLWICLIVWLLIMVAAFAFGFTQTGKEMARDSIARKEAKTRAAWGSRENRRGFYKSMGLIGLIRGLLNF